MCGTALGVSLDLSVVDVDDDIDSVVVVDDDEDGVTLVVVVDAVVDVVTVAGVVVGLMTVTFICAQTFLPLPLAPPHTYSSISHLKIHKVK